MIALLIFLISLHATGKLFLQSSYAHGGLVIIGFFPLDSVDRGHRYGYPGMANSAYGQDSYSRPAAKYAPPPYGVSQYGLGSGEMTPPPYTHALRESPLHYDLAQRLSQVHNRGPPKPSTQTHNLGPPKPSAPFY